MIEQARKNNGQYLTWVCLVVAGIIFLIDLSIPLGVAGGVPYVLVILIALSVSHRNVIIYMAILCSILTILGYYISPEGGEHWKVLANRSLALFAIWVVALLGLARRKTRDALKEAHHQLEERVERRTKALSDEVIVRRQTEEALSESEEKYRTLLENLPQKVFLKDRDSVYISCNAHYADDLNIRPDDIKGMTDFDFYPEELAEKYRADDKKIMDSRETEDLEEAYIYKGNELFVHTIKTPVFNDKGVVVALHGIFWDVTEKKCIEVALQAAHDDLERKVDERTVELKEEVAERKRAEEALKGSLAEKEVLLKEIHHRVKNNLQVIMSILNLQSRYIDDDDMKEVFKESQGRIKSMALIHEKLYQSSDLAMIDFADYIRNLTVSIFSGYKVSGMPVKLDIDIGKFTLDIDTCVTLGLIVNELCTNSLKYAFSHGKGGEIAIELNHCDDGRCVLTVRDNGIGLPEGFREKEADTMGHQLVDSMIAQLGGELVVTSEGGTCFEITFPC